MSTTHDIDNYDEALFQFDPFDLHQSLLGMSPSSDPPTIPAHAASLLSDVDNAFGPTDTVNTKGKGRTMPMPIRQPTIVRDLFEISSQKPSSPMSYDSSSSVMVCSPSTSNFSSDSNSLLGRHSSFLTDDREHSHSFDSASGSYTGKGKERAMLPPLTFSNIDLVIPLTPGPYYDDGASTTIHDHGSITDISISLPLHVHSSETGASLSKPPVSRCQSLTNLSHQAFPPSTGSPSTPLASSTFGPGAPINQSRHREMFEKDSLPIDHASLTLDLDLITCELDNQLPAWYTTPKTSDAKVSFHSRELFRPKGRSRSSPYPISALDIIPDTSTDIFQPLPIVIQNYFDLILPKELQLHILRTLVDLHEDDHQRSIFERRFTVAKATSSRGRWVGRDKGIRELFKLSRVCL